MKNSDTKKLITFLVFILLIVAMLGGCCSKYEEQSFRRHPKNWKHIKAERLAIRTLMA